MVLETIVLSSAIGYIAGSVIGRGTTVTQTDRGIKLVAVDIKEGYRKSMQDKNFRLMRDIAIGSGVAYVYAREEAKNRIARQRKKADSIITYNELCKTYGDVAEAVIDMKYDDYKGLSDHILENPNMSMRVAYMTKPSTSVDIDMEKFGNIYAALTSFQNIAPEFAEENSRCLAEFQAVNDFRKEAEAIKERSAKEILKGDTFTTKDRIKNLRDGHTLRARKK